GLVWLVFAGLSAWQARLIPFFAVVAGPVTALNFRDVLAHRSFARPGRAVVFVAAAGLLLLTWPGWLQGFRNRDRAAAWEVVADPSLVRVAGSMADRRQRTGRPPDDRIFTTHPDVADYLAWFGNGEKGFLD